jgi:hypothetical protein
MDYRTVAFYLAIIFIIGSIVEIYVRMKGIGERVEKIKGVVVNKPPSLGPPFVFLVFSIVLAVMTYPR